METTGLVLQLYRAYYGQIPLKLEPVAAPYDVAAALTTDGRTLTIGVVNPTESETEVHFTIAGVVPTGAVTRWHITGPDKFAHNTPCQPRVVDSVRTEGLASGAALRVPALSCSLFAIPLK